MFGNFFSSNNKDVGVADKREKATDDNARTIREAKSKIADATSAALNQINAPMKNITTLENPVSTIKDAYSRVQKNFSGVIESLTVDRDAIKINVSEAIDNINSRLTETTNELKKQSKLPPGVLNSIEETVTDTKNAFDDISSKANKIASSIKPSDISAMSIYSELIALYKSENIVARLTFLLLILFVFVLVLRIGTSILTWAFSHSTTPILLDGMINSKQMVQIPQNPAMSGAIPVLRSVNDDFGIGFTWSVWINIDDFTYKEKDYKHVFHKGNDNINLSTTPFGMNFPNNSPGLYIAPDRNDLVVVMNTFDSIAEEIKIKDIPLNKWVCVIIRVNEQKQLDVYINGTLTRRHILPSIPKQNYGDVYVSMNGGFSGNTSSLRYYAYPIGTNEIQSIVNSGPNTKMISSGGQMDGGSMEYLATRWFFQPNM